MNTKTALTLSAGLLLAAAQPSWSAPLYRVSATLTHADSPALSPVMVVEVGKPASMSIDDERHYSWKVQLSDIDFERNQATLQTELSLAQGHWQPSIRLELGKPASMSIGAMRMELLVEPHSMPQERGN